jgi:hypothetical protein
METEGFPKSQIAGVGQAIAAAAISPHCRGSWNGEAPSEKLDRGHSHVPVGLRALKVQISPSHAQEPDIWRDRLITPGFGVTR